MLLLTEALPAGLRRLLPCPHFLPLGELLTRGLHERSTRESDEPAEQREWLGVLTPATVYEGRWRQQGDESIEVEQQAKDTQEDGDDDVQKEGRDHSGGE